MNFCLRRQVMVKPFTQQWRPHSCSIVLITSTKTLTQATQGNLWTWGVDHQRTRTRGVLEDGIQVKLRGAQMQGLSLRER